MKHAFLRSPCSIPYRLDSDARQLSDGYAGLQNGPVSAQRGRLTAVINAVPFTSILFWTCCLCGFLPEKERVELDA